MTARKSEKKVNSRKIMTQFLSGERDSRGIENIIRFYGRRTFYGRRLRAEEKGGGSLEKGHENGER